MVHNYMYIYAYIYIYICIWNEHGNMQYKSIYIYIHLWYLYGTQPEGTPYMNCLDSTPPEPTPYINCERTAPVLWEVGPKSLDLGELSVAQLQFVEGPDLEVKEIRFDQQRWWFIQENCWFIQDKWWFSREFQFKWGCQAEFFFSLQFWRRSSGYVILYIYLYSHLSLSTYIYISLSIYIYLYKDIYIYVLESLHFGDILIALYKEIQLILQSKK